MALKGINARFYVGTTSGGTFTSVAELRDASISIDGQNIDVSFFGTSAWTTRIQSRKDANLSATGYLVPGDTNGQNAVLNALLNDTELWAQYLWDGTNGMKVQVRPGTFGSSADVDSIVGVSFTLESTGPVTLVP